MRAGAEPVPRTNACLFGKASGGPTGDRGALRQRGLFPDYRPFQLGLRFSAKALGPSTVSSLCAMAMKAG